jgi:hypothetical protein
MPLMRSLPRYAGKYEETKVPCLVVLDNASIHRSGAFKEKLTIVQHYRDRADCENNFDEIKNQWGWGGFVTHKIKLCLFIARIIALIYNWWSLFVRMA